MCSLVLAVGQKVVAFRKVWIVSIGISKGLEQKLIPLVILGHKLYLFTGSSATVMYVGTSQGMVQKSCALV